jgi:RNA polymerase sigma factor (sigma-70 family)
MQHHSHTYVEIAQMIGTLSARYGWTVITAEDLARHMQSMSLAVMEVEGLERVIIGHYTQALYAACRQDEDQERRERGYRDLFRYLYRIAYHRWPDMADVVAQQALQLVFTQLDRCREPAALLAFASFKLLQAHTEVVRRLGHDDVLEDLDDHEPVDVAADIVAGLERKETLEVLLAALWRLKAESRQVIYLKFFAAMSDEAISLQLGITISNVRTLRSRGLARLRQDRQLRAYMCL